MAQNATPDGEQTTTMVYASDADSASHGEDPEPATFRISDDRDTLDTFAANVSEGDYLAVVYQTPSNGGSLQRVMGHVETVHGLGGQADEVRFEVEDGTGDGPTGDEDATAYLHINSDTSDYFFSDGRGDGVPGNGFRLEKFAWTPER